MLEQKNITAIGGRIRHDDGDVTLIMVIYAVNCTADGRLNFENQETSQGVAYKYLRFSIAQWPRFFYTRAQTPESVLGKEFEICIVEETNVCFLRL